MNKNKNFIHKLCYISLIIIIILCTLNIIFNAKNQLYSAIISFILFMLNVFQLKLYKKNKPLFLLYLMIFYFNFSVIFGKYVFGGTALLNNLYFQLNDYNMTMSLGINLLLLFNAIIALIIGFDINENDEVFLKINDNKKRNFFSAFILFIPLFVLIYMVIKRIDYNTTYFEYLNIIFVFAFLLFKRDKKMKIITEVIMLILCFYSFYVGERIGALQILLVDFIINYLPKLKMKNIVIFSVLGIISLTIIGVYGDLYDTNNLKKFTPKFVYSEISSRRFTSDTSISAYFPNLACIEGRKNFDINYRLTNAFKYFTLYTVLGQENYNYELPNILISRYYFHSGGGFITGYFYFWFGILGVIAISLYIGYLTKKCVKNSDNKLFYKVYLIYFISTFPRWYLYYPTSLFRGTLIFALVYLMLKMVFKIKIIKDENEYEISINNSTHL